MRNTCSTGLLMALALLLLLPPQLSSAAGSGDQARELEKLKGSWKAVAVEIGGEKLPKEVVDANPAVMAICVETKVAF